MQGQLKKVQRVQRIRLAWRRRLLAQAEQRVRLESEQRVLRDSQVRLGQVVAQLGQQALLG